MSNRKIGQKAEGRNPDGTFAPGNLGKPKGTRHRATRAVENLMNGSSEALTQKALDMGLSGDTTALRLCIERIAPPRKDSPVSFDLSKIGNANEEASATSAVLTAVSSDDLTPHESASVMGLVENFRRVLETSEFEQRLAALWQSNENAPQAAEPTRMSVRGRSTYSQLCSRQESRFRL